MDAAGRNCYRRLRKFGYQAVYEFTTEKIVDLSRIATGLLLTAKSVLNPGAFGVAGAIFYAPGHALLVRPTYMTRGRVSGGGRGRGGTGAAVVRRGPAGGD